MTDDVVTRKSKGTDPPRCKVCGDRHWGVCSNRSPIGAIADQAPKAGAARLTIEGRVAGRSVSDRRVVAADTAPGLPTVSTGIAAVMPGDKPLTLGEVVTARAALDGVTTRGTPRKRAPKGTFDRKKHQREAARKRRAAKKATGTGTETRGKT